MRLSHLDSSMYRQMPWKNGLGMTTEIARAPGEGDFDWRVSMARVVADGPFSTFPGCNRVILTLEGAGMILSHHDTGTEVTLGPFEPWAFNGDWPTSCRLRDGPIRDFNVIARRASFVPVVSVLRPADREAIRISATTTLLYCAAGALIVEAAATIELAADQTLLLEQTSGETERLLIRPSAPRTTVIQAALFTTAPS